MGYWKTRVLPNLKKVFKSGKKSAAAEASKAFEPSKEVIIKEFDEKKTELQPKVVEIYEASSVEIKSILKDPKEAGIKKHPAEVQQVLEKLAAIDFPGSKTVSELSKQFGSGLVSGPVLFIFEKVSTVLPKEVVVVEKELAPSEIVEAAATTTEEETPAATTTTIVAEREIVEVEGSTEKELVVVADKKEEIETPPPTTTTTTTAAPTSTTPVEEVVAVIKTETPTPAEPVTVPKTEPVTTQEPVPVPKTEPVKTPEVVAPVAPAEPPAAEPKKP